MPLLSHESASMPPSRPSFADLGVPSDIVAVLAAQSITAPFPIQEMTLPDALAGRDVCGRAPTGSGKTLAFGIGAIARLGGQAARSRHPRVLVLTPTRELAAQVAAELRLLGAPRGLRVESFYGGVGYGPQLRSLSRGVDVVVACPGRLGDLIERGSIRLDGIEIVIVDEADRMADMGFLPDVRRILDRTPEGRQTMLFSATLDGDIDVLVRRYQQDPARHELEIDEEEAGNALHLFWRVGSGDRLARTAETVAAAGPTIVFSRTRHGTDRITRQLEQRGVRAVSIHGDRSQRQRERALDSFARGAVDALVATDVAARGIHVDGVNAVVHFDPPADAKDYVHRSGRTARAGASGVVVSLVTPDKAGAVKKLQREVGVPIGTSEPDMDAVTAATPIRRPGRAKPVTSPRSAPSGAPSPHTAQAHRGVRSKRGNRGKWAGSSKQGKPAGSAAGRRGRGATPAGSTPVSGTGRPRAAGRSRQPPRTGGATSGRRP